MTDKYDKFREAHQLEYMPMKEFPKTVLPNFDRWGELVWNKDAEGVAESLKAAFDQGRALGRSEGYDALASELVNIVGEKDGC